MLDSCWQQWDIFTYFDLHVNQILWLYAKIQCTAKCKELGVMQAYGAESTVYRFWYSVVRICISNDTTCRTLRRANSARVVCRVVHAVSAVIHRPAIDFSGERTMYHYWYRKIFLKLAKILQIKRHICVGIAEIYKSCELVSFFTPVNWLRAIEG